MINYLEKTGKTDDEAIAAALEEIGLDRDDVSVEIIERAKPGFLGIGSVPARVRVSWESEDKEPEAAAPAAAAPEKAAEVPAAQTETAAPAKQSEPVQAPAAPAEAAACWSICRARAWAQSSDAAARRWTPFST